ncbi:MAG TPA: SEC-C metal-binding domain-containing protein [Candidatus Limnocylindrales bacterium]
MPRPTISSTVAEILADHHALGDEELGRLVAQRGVTRAADPAKAVARALESSSQFHRLMDDRWILPYALLEGSTLAHRLSAREAETGLLALAPDLGLLLYAADSLTTADDHPLDFHPGEFTRDMTGLDSDGSLAGPEGWLAAYADKLVGVRVANGQVSVSKVPEPDARARMAGRQIAARARAILDEQAADGGDHASTVPALVSVKVLIFETLAEDPDLLRRPLQPLGELFTEAGLDVWRGFVGLPGTDWTWMRAVMTSAEQAGDSEDDITDEEAADRLVEDFDLEPVEVDALRVVIGAWEFSAKSGALPPKLNYRALAELLRLPGVARVLSIYAWKKPEIEPFAAAMAEAADARSAAGPRFVLGVCALARDDALTAERQFKLALEADPEHDLALQEMASCETFRGNYARALGHLRAAGVPADDPDRAWLEALVRPAFAGTGRNDPCPCGSGRKYKFCHLGAPGIAAAVDLAAALKQKLDIWISQPNVESLLDALDLELLDSEPDPGLDADDDWDVFQSGIPDDVLLFDRGQLQRFIDVWGPLLPADEPALARSWLSTRRTLVEVAGVHRGQSVTVRDLLGTGAEVLLADRSLSSVAEPLDLLCLRILPDGRGGFVPSDGLAIPRPRRMAAMEVIRSGDGMALLRWLDMPAAPPSLVNMENEPTLFITATYRLPDPAAAAAGLRRKLRDDGDGRFVELVARDGQDWIRGSIDINGDVAKIEANSAKRADRLEKTLLRAAPGARLIVREERGSEEMLAEMRDKGPLVRSHDGALDPADHPEVAAAVEEFMRDMEVRWLDTPVPALGDLTPRQAAADPKSLPELLALLNDYEWSNRRAGPGKPSRGGMNVARLRGLLGLH